MQSKLVVTVKNFYFNLTLLVTIIFVLTVVKIVLYYLTFFGTNLPILIVNNFFHRTVKFGYEGVNSVVHQHW